MVDTQMGAVDILFFCYCFLKMREKNFAPLFTYTRCPLQTSSHLKPIFVNNKSCFHFTLTSPRTANSLKSSACAERTLVMRERSLNSLHRKGGKVSSAMVATLSSLVRQQKLVTRSKTAPFGTFLCFCDKHSFTFLGS